MSALHTVPGTASPASSKHRSRRVTAVVVVAALCLVTAVLSACAGAIALTIPDVLHGMAGGANAFVVQSYRLPRIGVALLAGAALAVAGVFLQAAVRNPLASPDVIGVTKGAGLGAMIATVLVPPAAAIWAVPLGVIAGAVLVTGLLLALARAAGGRGVTLALVGVAIAALAAAAMEYLMVLFPQNADQAMVWLAGSVYGSTPDDVLFLVIWLAVCLPVVILTARRLDLAGFGDDTQNSLGHRPAGSRALLVAVAVALAAGAVAVVGGIGFLGLIAPHLARLLVGARARWLVPVSALIGALMLCLADLAGRLIALPNEIPAGIVAAVLGGPYLLFLLIREARTHG